MKTVFIANRGVNIIREREFVCRHTHARGDSIEIIPQGIECHLVSENGPVIAVRDSYDEALNWIKQQHLNSIDRLRAQLAAMTAKHKHVVKFYPLKP